VHIADKTAAAGCAACAKAEEDRRAAVPLGEFDWLTPKHRPCSGACPGCGRKVHLLGGGEMQGWRDRRGFLCSDRCQNRVYGARYRARHPRPRRMVPLIQCQVCGENFAPKRADAKTCSQACRQKAYRQRRSRDG
jgi:predicted nucleic acid-binding Zn ribbon protein